MTAARTTSAEISGFVGSPPVSRTTRSATSDSVAADAVSLVTPMGRHRKVTIDLDLLRRIVLHPHDAARDLPRGRKPADRDGLQDPGHDLGRDGAHHGRVGVAGREQAQRDDVIRFRGTVRHFNRLDR